MLLASLTGFSTAFVSVLEEVETVSDSLLVVLLELVLVVVVVVLVWQVETTGLTLGPVFSLLVSFATGCKDVDDVVVVTNERGCCVEYDLLVIILTGEKILFTLVGDLSLLLNEDLTAEAFELEILLRGI